jgi:hypothetical protein
MAYYLSQRNKKILAPYLKLLEASKKDLAFHVKDPIYFRDQIRNAFNTSHKHLKDLWRVVVQPEKIHFYRIEDQLRLEIDNIVRTPAGLFQIAQAILDGNVPIIFTSALISEQELDSLASLAEAKSLTINFNSPELEISYG